MNLLLVACLVVAVPLVAIGIYTLQELLECRDQQKHAQD